MDRKNRCNIQVVSSKFKILGSRGIICSIKNLNYREVDIRIYI